MLSAVSGSGNSAFRVVYEDKHIACVYRPAFFDLDAALNLGSALRRPKAMLSLEGCVAGLCLVAKTRDALYHISGDFDREYEKRGLQYAVQQQYRNDNPFALSRTYSAILLGNAWAAGAAASDEDENSCRAYDAAVNASEASHLATFGDCAWRWAWRRWSEDAHPTKQGSQRLLDLHSSVDGIEVQTTIEVVGLSEHPTLGTLSHVRMETDALSSERIRRANRLLGRLPQLRLHTAALGTPILGDADYWTVATAVRAALRQDVTAQPFSVSASDAQSIHLANCGMSFQHPIDGSQVIITVPEPADFANLRAAGEREGIQYEVKKRYESDNGFYRA